MRILLVIECIDNLIIHQPSGILAFPEFTKLFLELIDLLFI